MASDADLFEARLRLKDPIGPIVFGRVANKAAIGTPVHQTGYVTTDTGFYYLWSDVVNPTTLAISDARLGDLIDTHGVDSAVCRAIYDVMAVLGQQLTVVKDATGAESVEYSTIKDQMAYLRDLRRQCKELEAEKSGSNTSRYATTETVVIAGGDL